MEEAERGTSTVEVQPAALQDRAIVALFCQLLPSSARSLDHLGGPKRSPASMVSLKSSSGKSAREGPACSLSPPLPTGALLFHVQSINI